MRVALNLNEKSRKLSERRTHLGAIKMAMNESQAAARSIAIDTKGDLHPPAKVNEQGLGSPSPMLR